MMNTPNDRYWQLRLEKCKAALERNKFEAFLVADSTETRHLIMDQLLPAINPRSVSWGDSMTLTDRCPRLDSGKEGDSSDRDLCQGYPSGSDPGAEAAGLAGRSLFYRNQWSDRNGEAG